MNPQQSTVIKTWELLSNIPVDDGGLIQEQFQFFPIDTNREDIWHWIEEEYNVSVHDLMFYALGE
jgi:hypothetical protein